MKRTSILHGIAMLAIVCSLFTFSSCSKDKDDPAPSIIGLWKGKYGNGATTYPTSGYAFLFRKDGTVRVFNNADTATAGKSEGTYTLSGSTVTTNYTYLAPASGTYSTTATVNANFSFMEGSWGSGTSTTSGGKFFINK